MRSKTFLHALAFVGGFTLIFVAGWGGAATVFGQLFVQYKIVLGQVGGVIVIAFGLFTLGILKIRWLNYDTRPDWVPKGRMGLISSGLMGVTFAAGWSPCIGTTLGAILTLGFSQDTSGQAMILSSGYAIGLGIPFLALGLGMNRAMNIMSRMRRYQGVIRIVSGLLLIAIGIFLVTGRMILIAIWAQKNGFYFDPALGGAAVPSYLVAMLAGLISFLSPCVLPLVPAYLGYLSGQAVINHPIPEKLVINQPQSD